MKQYYVQKFDNMYDHEKLKEMVTNDFYYEGLFEEMANEIDLDPDDYFCANDAINYLIERGEVVDVTKGRYQFAYSGIRFSNIEDMKNGLLKEEMEIAGCANEEELLQSYIEDGIVVDLFKTKNY